MHRAAFLLALLGAGNSILALFRDRLLASSFGASRTLDIYYAAFRVPDTIFSLSLFVVASTAFIPIFLEERTVSRQRAQDFFDSVVGVFILGISVMGVIAWLLMPRLVVFVVPGFSSYEQQQVMHLARILLLSPVFLGLSGIFSAVVQASHRFFSYALAPILYNLGIIFGVLVLMPRLGLAGLAGGVVAGAFLHMVVQIPTLLRLHGFPRPQLKFARGFFRLVRYSFPRACALSFNQFTLMVLTALASFLGTGAIAIFNLSQNLFMLPLTIIGLSYSVAAFPTMAELALKDDKKIFFDHLVAAARSILFWTLPIFGLFLVLRAHIVRLVLGVGAFAWVDTHLTTASLLLFSYAIVTQSMVALFVRAYYALGRVREPILYSAAASLITIGIALAGVMLVEKSAAVAAFFSFFVRLRIKADIAFLSLPLAYSAGAFANAVLLGWGLLRLNGAGASRELFRAAFPITIVALAASLTGFGVLKALGPLFELESFIEVFLQASIAGLAAFVVGMFVCEVLSVREYRELKEALFSKWRGAEKRDILQPEVEHL